MIVAESDGDVPIRDVFYDLRPVRRGGAFAPEFMDHVFANAQYASIPVTPPGTFTFTPQQFNALTSSLRRARTVDAFMDVVTRVRTAVSNGREIRIARDHPVYEKALKQILNWDSYSDQGQFVTLYKQFAQYPIVTGAMIAYDGDGQPIGRLAEQLHTYKKSPVLFSTHFVGENHFITAHFDYRNAIIQVYDSLRVVPPGPEGPGKRAFRLPQRITAEILKLANAWETLKMAKVKYPGNLELIKIKKWDIQQRPAPQQGRGTNDCAMYSIWKLLNLAMGVIDVDEIHDDKRRRGRAMRCVLAMAYLCGSIELMLDANIVRAVARWPDLVQ